jgi:hypothetical protein
MKKLLLGMLVLAAVFTAVPAHAEDSVIDKAGDWIATVGKSPEEKDRILLERRTDRATKALGKALNDGAESADKSARKLGKELEGAFK